MFLKGKKKIKYPFLGVLHHVMSLEQNILEISTFALDGCLFQEHIHSLGITLHTSNLM
jgi:hypothetical protein